jgi:arabinoxylan arabinofuranohydrolase
VAPITVSWDEKPVSEGGTVSIRAYDPYAENHAWTAKDNQGKEYKGAEVTSEGFHLYGLNPYQYYSAGYASYLSDNSIQQDSWDIWDSHMAITNIKNGHIIGYKYFGFGGLAESKNGLKAFEGTKKGNKTAFNLFLTPRTTHSFKVNVWLDGPWDNETWKGKKIAEIIVPANAKQQITRFTVDVSKFVDNLDKKHAIFLVAEGAAPDTLFNLTGLGFSSAKKKIVRPIVPTVKIAVNGMAISLPETPVRSTDLNGLVSYDQYETSYTIPAAVTAIPAVSASANNAAVKVKVTQATGLPGKATVSFDYKGIVKTYTVVFEKGQQ